MDSLQSHHPRAGGGGAVYTGRDGRTVSAAPPCGLLSMCRKCRCRVARAIGWLHAWRTAWRRAQRCGTLRMAHRESWSDSKVRSSTCRPGDARIAPQAKKFCEIRANYDRNLLKLSVRPPVRGVRAEVWPTSPGAGVKTGQRLWRAVLVQLY